MMTPNEREQAADILIKAERECIQAKLLSETFPHIQIEDSYAISSIVAQRKIKRGCKTHWP
jgi:2-oxo-hept-3-ene-1,7-dioate hydratase